MKMPLRVLPFLVITPLVLGGWWGHLHSLPRGAKAQAQTAWTQGQTVNPERLANGIAVRRGHLSDDQDEILRFMNANAMRITLDDVPTNKPMDFSVVIRRRGKPDIREVYESFEKPSAHQEYTICLMPADTQTDHAEKLTVIVESKTEEKTAASSSSSISTGRRIMINPFKECSAVNVDPRVSEDKTGITLMMGEKGNHVSFPTRNPYAEIRIEVISRAAPLAAAQAAPIAR